MKRYLLVIGDKPSETFVSLTPYPSVSQVFTKDDDYDEKEYEDEYENEGKEERVLKIKQRFENEDSDEMAN